MTLGIESYNLLLSNVHAAYIENRALDWRSFSFFCDHKHMMLLRYQYLLDHDYLCKNEEIFQELTTLKNKWIILQNTCIKYNMTHERKILDGMEEQISELKKVDEKVIRELLVSL